MLIANRHHKSVVGLWSLVVSGVECRRMSRKPAVIKIVNLEESMPTVERARLLLENELATARAQGYKALKIIHGYGYSGAGGALRAGLQATLRRAAHDGDI